MAHESFRDVFVSNNPVPLTSGHTENLAVGQLGFFLYDPKSDRVAVTPDFRQHKVIQLFQGTPELPGNLLAAVANQSKASKPIKGKKILSWEGRAAQRGQTQQVAIGFDGVDLTKSMNALCEQSKTVFVKLSGGPIDEIFHTEGKGYITMYSLFSGCCDDCGDDCAQVSAEKMADDLVTQIMKDPLLSLGTRTGNKVIRARKVISTAAVTPDDTCQEYLLAVCDNGGGTDLGLVQSQNTGSVVRLKSRTGSTSVYSLIQDSDLDAPADFDNSGVVLITDCPTCPTGYTLVNNGFAYKVVRMDAGDAAAMDAVATTYGIVSPELISRISHNYGESTYVMVSATAVTPVTPVPATPGVNEVQSVIATGGTAGTFTLTFDGETTGAIAYNATAAAVQTALLGLSNLNPGDVVASGGPLPGTAVTLTFGGTRANSDVPTLVVTDSITGGDAVVTTVTPGSAGTPAILATDTLQLLSDDIRSTCVLTTPSTIAWAEGEQFNRFNKEFSITLRDNVCGTSRLAELQAAYPGLVIVEALAGECVRKFTTSVTSDCVPIDCPADVPLWIAPEAFEGIQWTAAAPTYTGTPSVGVIIESAFFDRTVGECAYDYWSFDSEPIFIKISEHSNDYNGKPTTCIGEWPITEIQAAKIPIGVGSQVREIEAFFKGYERKYRDPNPIVRAGQDSILQADPDVFYDQYTLSFEFDFHQSWFSEKFTDSYRLEIYVPEGTGKQLEALVNGYIASAAIDLEPVVL